MTIDTSTANVLLAGVIAMQCWIIRELFKLKAKVSIIILQCSSCKNNATLDTDQIKRQ